MDKDLNELREDLLRKYQVMLDEEEKMEKEFGQYSRRRIEQ